MRGSRFKRVVIVVAGALGAAAMLFLMLVKLNAQWGFTGATGTGAFGWTLPLLAGLLIGGVAWFLLFTAPPYTSEETARHSIPCPSCEKAVMESWRLCPYCGRILPSSVSRPAAGESPREQHG